MTARSSAQQSLGFVSLPINPYAPTATPNPRQLVQLRRVSSMPLILSTIAGATVCGGLLGITYLLIAMLTLSPSDDSAARLVLNALASSGVTFAGAVAIVPLLSTACLRVRAPGSCWTAEGMSGFAAMCGWLTGTLGSLFLAGFTSGPMVWVLIAAVISAAGTSLAVLPLARQTTVQPLDRPTLTSHQPLSSLSPVAEPGARWNRGFGRESA